MKETTLTKSGHRPINVIAREVLNDIKNEKNQQKFYAMRPYLEAMLSLHDITDNYMFDSAKSVVLYFLSNARVWRGENAKAIKNELNNIVK